ncbi:MAG: hypothetical protein ACRD2L_00630 [Terriglobia bacterium]
MTKQERKRVSRAERQRTELQLHHIKKLRDHRHLRFERCNVIVCCQKCHKELERKLDEELARGGGAPVKNAGGP